MTRGSRATALLDAAISVGPPKACAASPTRRSTSGDPLAAGFWSLRTTTGHRLDGPPDVRSVLMARLGYDRYGAQGGGLGFAISHYLGVIDPGHVAGVHVNTLTTFSPWHTDPGERAALDDDDRQRIRALGEFGSRFAGYRALQSTRPRTPSYALADSPVGQLAWIVDLFRGVNETNGLAEDTVDRDQLLTNVMLYRLTATAGSSARVYRETGAANPMDESSVPMGVAQFPGDARAVRRFAEREYPNIARWTEYPRGGHYAAMEQPLLLTEDIRAFFRLIR